MSDQNGRGLFQNPYAQLQNLFPEQAMQHNEMAKAYIDAYNQRNFGTEHPIITGLLAGTLGGGGLVGGINAVLGAKQADRQRQANLLKSYQDWSTQQLTQQKALDELATPRNQVLAEQALRDEAKKRGLIDINVPDLYSRSLDSINYETGEVTPAKQASIPVLSREYLENQRKGLFGGSDINYLRNLQQADTASNYRLPTQSLGGYAGQGNTLQGNVGMTQGGPAEVPAPFYVSDPQSIMQSLTSTTNNALNAGQNRYQFDQEAPKRAAEINSTNALAELRKKMGVTEGFRPGLVQSQTGANNALTSLRNRTDPNLRSGGGRADQTGTDISRLQSIDANISQKNSKGEYIYKPNDPYVAQAVAARNVLADRLGLPRLMVNNGAGRAAGGMKGKSPKGFTTGSGVRVKGL